ncbi:MAG TPA: glycosyltransferase [Fibrobacteria bacterium]|nr:glycosyltransferase [Fibrobacteria bacterium]
MDTKEPILLVSPWPSRNNGLSNYAVRYKAELERQGVKVPSERLYFWGEKTSFWKWIPILRRARREGLRRILVQHTPTCSGPLLPWFLGRARKSGIRIVVVSHETPSTYARHLDGFLPGKAAYLAYERAVARRAQAFVVHTRLHAREMENLDAPATATIPHAILNMPESVLPWRPETIGIYGQIGRKKGHDLVVDAIQSRPPGFFPILEIWGAPGVGQESYLDELKHRVAPGYADRILFRGYLPEDGKAEAFSRMRLAVFPYRWISQSGALAEAVAHQVPYLASGIPFFEEFQKTHLCGDLFRSDDVQDLASRLAEILASPPRWTPADFQRLHSSLSISRCCQELLHLFGDTGLNPE